MRLLPLLLLVFPLLAIADPLPAAAKKAAAKKHDAAKKHAPKKHAAKKHAAVRHGKAGKKGKGKVAAAGSFLACNPPLLKNPVCGSSFSVALRRRPAGTVTLYIDGPNVSFSKCRLDFTPATWNKRQAIHISPLPYLTAVKRTRVVKLRLCSSASAKDAGLHKACQQYSIHRNGGAGATCGISGDPHYNSFGKRAFGFQGLGVFYVVKSDALTIQAAHAKWRGTSASVQKKIAIRYHDTVVCYNGHTGKIGHASKSKKGVRIVKSHGYWNFRLSDGSAIRLGHHSPGADYHISLAITLGQAYKGNTGGLCGSFGTKNFLMPSGKVAKNTGAFGGSWRVARADNLFILGGRAASVKKFDAACGNAMRRCKIPKINPLPVPKPAPRPEPRPEPKPAPRPEPKPAPRPEPKPAPRPEPKPGPRPAPGPGPGPDHDRDDYGDGGEPLEKGDVVVDPTDEVDLAAEEKEINILIEAKPTPPKVVKESWIKLARESCIRILTIKDANDILNPKIYIEECVDDLKLTGSYTFLETARRSYLSAVMRLVTSTKYEPVVNRGVSEITINLNVIIKNIETTYGFGKNKCPKDCSGRGECTEAGCACVGGYTSIDCSESLPKEISVIEVFTEKEAPEEDLDVEDAPEAKILVQVEEVEKSEPEMETEEKDDEDEAVEEAKEAEQEVEEEEKKGDTNEEAKEDTKEEAKEETKEEEKKEETKEEEKKEN